MNLTGRQLMSQKSTSEKGVLEREEAFDSSRMKLMQCLSRMARQIFLVKKALTETMEKRVKLNETKMLHRSQQREALEWVETVAWRTLKL